MILGSTSSEKANWSEIKILLPAGMIGALPGRLCPADAPHPAGADRARRIRGSRRAFASIFRRLQPTGAACRASGQSRPDLVGGGAGALFGAGSPPYIIYLTRRLHDKGEVCADVLPG